MKQCLIITIFHPKASTHFSSSLTITSKFDKYQTLRLPNKNIQHKILDVFYIESNYLIDFNTSNRHGIALEKNISSYTRPITM